MAIQGLPWWFSGKKKKNLLANARDADSIPGQEGPLEKDMATHFSIITWEVPWTEDPTDRQSMEQQKSQTQLNNNNNMATTVHTHTPTESHTHPHKQKLTKKQNTGRVEL